ncbi:MAG: hypothetical protein GY855_14350 [candidate division Zixibacteria bacterium]|nr:hypothetical protein [candidate division Zixibacteria bacterium]
MAETVKIVDYFYAEVSDRPGEARRLIEHLSEKGVNLIAFSSFPSGEDKSQLDFFPVDSKLLLSAANDSGIELKGPKKALLVQGEDRIGALYSHLLKLANVNVNVYASNGVNSGSGMYGYIIWVKQDEINKAMEALMNSETSGKFGTLRPGGMDW